MSDDEICSKLIAFTLKKKTVKVQCLLSVMAINNIQI